MIKVIHTEDEYHAALEQIRARMMDDPAPGTPAGDELRLLALVVADYEARMYPADLPDPIEALVFRMEQQDLRPVDLVPYIGSRGRVSEVLACKRPLTLPMIRRLHAALGIPAEVLIREVVPETPTGDETLTAA